MAAGSWFNRLRRPAAVAVPFLALCLPAFAGAEVLRAERVNATANQQEFVMTIRAQAPRTSWETPGRECTLLEIRIDGRYDQHIFLVHWTREEEYPVQIGPLAPGEHLLEILWDRSWRPDLAERPIVTSVTYRAVEGSMETLLRAPILYLRPDTIGRFSDLPLLVYTNVEPGDLSAAQMTYTVILTNEDGGTNTERLMARWGRTTDIEWFYAYDSVDGRFREIIQGPDHKTLPFVGTHEGKHPVIFDVTQNNNFSDKAPPGASVRVRLVPVDGALGGRARETVMDRFPWTYAVTAAEMRREGRIEDPGNPATAAVSDPRNYLAIEVCAEQSGTELFFEAILRDRPSAFSSDHGDPKARIGRNGCFRSTIELPPGTRAADLDRIRIHATAAPAANGQEQVADPVARVLSVPTAFLFAADFSPGKPVLNRRLDRNLRPGESIDLPVH